MFESRATSREESVVLSNLIRWGGLAAVVAGVIYVLQGIVALFVPRPAFISSSD